MASDMETLATTTPAKMTEELERNRATFDWTPGERALAKSPLLVLSADDGLAPSLDKLAAEVRAVPGAHVTMVHVATDHSWNDQRIRLESEVIRWLQALPDASGNP